MFSGFVCKFSNNKKNQIFSSSFVYFFIFFLWNVYKHIENLEEL